ncbi:uncharacterized protein NPIL_411691 [Nephila pilipes]|uniref:Uncharacterized protein n=1 Tax=Nephila pilipes TaxID=299642 RepID=A0A8X6IL12_NEPPI|nr:uncharacterized protein NPIL_411691 [Nephila pilipes]
MPHASEIPCNDELKVYRVEGVGEEEERSSAENLKDVKTSLVTEEEAKNATNFSSSSKSPRPSAEPSGPASLHGKPFEHQHFLPPTPYGYVVAPYHPHPNGPYGAISMGAGAHCSALKERVLELNYSTLKESVPEKANAEGTGEKCHC